jgi:CheY-like chemotaxis protein
MKALDCIRKAGKENDPFHVVMIDSRMPGTDSFALAGTIRYKEAGMGVRLVLVNEEGQTTDEKMYEELAFSGQLVKPVCHSDLLDCIIQVMDGKTAVARSEKQPVEKEKDRSRFRILLAEDDVTNQAVAMGLMKKLGLNVDVVESGIEAIESLKINHYDLVLMDVQMPHMDGFAATQLIRDHQSGVLDHQVPVIAMTAHALQGYRDYCIEMGMNDYITKPIDIRVFPKVLDKWLFDGGDQIQ